MLRLIPETVGFARELAGALLDVAWYLGCRAVWEVTTDA